MTRKRKVVRKKKNSRRKSTGKTTRPLLDLMLMSLAELYPHDALVPGLSVAYLPKEGEFYASVVRYDNHKNVGTHTFEQRKQVLTSARASSLLLAIQQLANDWVNNNQHSLQMLARTKTPRTRKAKG